MDPNRPSASGGKKRPIRPQGPQAPLFASETASASNSSGGALSKYLRAPEQRGSLKMPHAKLTEDLTGSNPPASNSPPSPVSVDARSPQHGVAKAALHSASDSSTIAVSCFVCQVDLTLFNFAARESHVNACLDNPPAEPPAAQPPEPEAEGKCPADEDPSVEDEAEHADLAHISGLKAEEFCCVVCGLDISRRGLFNRCFHVKRCAREHRMSVKDVIRMLEPDDLMQPIDLTAVEEEEDVAFTSSISLSGAGSNLSLGKATGSENSINSVLMRNARHSVREAAESAAGSAADRHAVLMMQRGAQEKTINNVLMTAAREGAAASKKRSAEEVVPAVGAAAGAAAAKRSGGAWAGKRWGYGGNQQAKGGGDNYQQDGYAPDYKKIQYDSLVVPIVVDGFHYSSPALTDTYFLTHFHSDHYGGLDAKFDCGRIYCSPSTAALVQLRLRVRPSVLVPLALEVKHTVVVGGSQVGVTLIDANHCPGAVLVLFEFRSGRKVLHTGDFRYTLDMPARSPALRELARSASNSRNLVVYLDTTYCDPQYCFPEQRVAIQAVVDAVRREMSNSAEQTLFAFGAYGIGKERVFMAVAQALDLKVFVDGSRWKAMMCYDWSVADKARLTTDGSSTPLWVVAMSQINFKALAELRNKANVKKSPKKAKAGVPSGASTNKNPFFTRVIGFQPTGWSHKPAGGSGESELVTPRCKGKDIVYSVPYSEHSSFTELIAFVDTFKPQRIVPTVNTGKDKVRSQIQLIKDHAAVYAAHGEA